MDYIFTELARIFGFGLYGQGYGSNYGYNYGGNGPGAAPTRDNTSEVSAGQYGYGGGKGFSTLFLIILLLLMFPSFLGGSRY